MISITEIVLIVAGFAAIIIGYLLPAGKDLDEEDKVLMEREIRELVRREVEDQKETIENMVDDTVDNSLDRTERAMERISNEKMSAIGEYSDTVINDIHKNHDEVMFMYDMLNDKHKNLTNVVSEVTKKADEAKQTVLDAQITAKEAKQATEASVISPEVAKPVEIPKEERVRAVLIDEVDNKLSGIRIPYTEKKVVTPSPATEPDDTPVPINNDNTSGGYANERNLKDRREFDDIPAKVISSDDLSGLHVIGGSSDEQAPATNSKVVPITEAVRVEGKMKNPDKNMQELTANDPASQNKQIIEMHKQGKSNMVIARELGLGIGEVKLVIDLSNKHRKVK